MKYKVEWVEVVQEGVGKKGPWKKSKMSLTDEAGAKEENVVTFLEVQAGQEITGTIETNLQYHTREFKKTLEKPKFMQKSIEVAMDKKNESIAKFQGNKEESIKLMAAQRDAVLLVVAELNNSKGVTEDFTGERVKQEIIKWRNWFLLDKEFNNPPPFL